MVRPVGESNNPVFMEKEPAARKIWLVAAAVFATLLVAAAVFLPFGFSAAVIVISSLVLLVLLVSECARRFLKKPGVLGALDNELFAVAQAAAAYFKRDKDPEPVPGAEPIVLVHGYFHNESAWGLFKKRLKKGGVDNPLYTISLGHPCQSIEAYSQRLQERIQEIKEKTGSKTVKLVGHSMGGLVSLHAAAADRESVSEVITLGSPLRGTKMASLASILFLGKSAAAKEMGYESPFVEGLKNRVSKAEIRCTHLGSDGDMIIRPASSANPEGKGVQFPHLGHLFLLYSEQTAAEVARILKVPAISINV